MQQSQYEVIKEKMQETSRMRHDLRQQLRVMSGLPDSKKYDVLDKYLAQCKNSIPNNIINIYSNNAVNALAGYYDRISKDLGININLDSEIPFTEADICMLIGNLEENAIDGCKIIETDNKYLSTKTCGSGIGLSSVSATVKHYKETLKIQDTDNKFCVSVRINSQE